MRVRCELDVSDRLIIRRLSFGVGRRSIVEPARSSFYERARKTLRCDQRERTDTLTHRTHVDLGELAKRGASRRNAIRIAGWNRGRQEVVTYVRANAYSVPRDSICQRGCVVLFHGPDSISMYARPGKTQPDTRLGTLARLSSPRACSPPSLPCLKPVHLFLHIC